MRKKSGEKENQVSSETPTNIKELECEIERLNAEIAEKNDKYLRAMADIQNINNRNARQQREHSIDIKKRYLKEFINIDELLIAVHDDSDPKKGIVLIQQNIHRFLESEHIHKIETVGQIFDHNLHHAVTVIETDEQPEGTILEEIRPGYKMDELVILPAHVVVAQKPSESTLPSKDNAGEKTETQQ